MTPRQFLQSHTLTIVLSIIIVLVLVMGAFSVGERVGYHKASFAFQNGNNFYHTFGPSSDGHPMPMNGDFSDTHGTVGKVIGVTLPTITIEDKDHTEKTIMVSDQTVIRQLRNTVAPKDIAVGDYVVAIGEPNAQSQIAATLIRILPQ